MFVDPKILIMKCEKTHCVCQIGVWCEKGLCVDDDVLLPPPPQPPTHPSTSTRLRSVNVTVTSLDNQVSMDLIESSVMERGRGVRGRRRPSLFCCHGEGRPGGCWADGGEDAGGGGLEGEGYGCCPPLSHSKAVTSFPGSASAQGVSEVTDDVMAGRERRMSEMRQCNTLARHTSKGVCECVWWVEGGSRAPTLCPTLTSYYYCMCSL